MLIFLLFVPAADPVPAEGGLIQVLVAVKKISDPVNDGSIFKNTSAPIMYLASSASDYVTGQTLFIDGGWTAW